MGQFTKIVAWAGFIAALGLCLFDLYTSVLGLRLILGTRDNSPIAVFMPVIFATLALCFNGLSAYLFRMYLQIGLGTFASAVTTLMWVFFVVYDGASSFIGMMDTYSSIPIHSWDSLVAAMEQIGGIGSFFVVVMALLLSFGPFLCCMFYELATSKGRPEAAHGR